MNIGSDLYRHAGILQKDPEVHITLPLIRSNIIRLVF